MSTYAFSPEWEAERQRLACLDALWDRASRRALETAGVPSGARCLDVGAGDGSVARLLAEPRSTALYLSPTKALGADQLRAVEELAEHGLDGVRAASYDGDTPNVERDWVRAHGRWVFTNPDMLHHGVLAQHSRWTRFFRNLAYVVVDECHTYRGVFGSHVALLLRRLRRIAQHYGAEPTFVLASATVADPAELGTRLTGVECRA